MCANNIYLPHKLFTYNIPKSNTHPLLQPITTDHTSITITNFGSVSVWRYNYLDY